MNEVTLTRVPYESDILQVTDIIEVFVLLACYVGFIGSYRHFETACVHIFGGQAVVDT